MELRHRRSAALRVPYNPLTGDSPARWHCKRGHPIRRTMGEDKSSPTAQEDPL